MIANILFFVGYTILVFILASRRVKELLDILQSKKKGMMIV